MPVHRYLSQPPLCICEVRAERIETSANSGRKSIHEADQPKKVKLSARCRGYLQECSFDWNVSSKPDVLQTRACNQQLPACKSKSDVGLRLLVIGEGSHQERWIPQ
jgi:hypothetical protein